MQMYFISINIKQLKALFIYKDNYLISAPFKSFDAI